MSSLIHSSKVKIVPGDSYKIGMDEVEDMQSTMIKALKPLAEFLKDRIYWNAIRWTKAEYKSRDGFIANSHNCGGLMFTAVIPECEQYNWPCLEFGEHNEDCEYHNGNECSCGGDEGHLDACLRIWIKFEGFDQDDGKMMFYINISGGNEDAPYFRANRLADVYENSFKAESMTELQYSLKKQVRKMINILKGGAQ